ncbi:MAG TPA: hypothetical protein VGY57_04260 [Vicinamibacterales bacterium]|nr:hypothetical protein [Vicinamibacterales bacterium]
MQQRQLRLGDILDDYCPRERRVTNHAVVAMVGDDVKQTRCTTCDADHEYKHAKVPRQRRKNETPAALTSQILAGAPKRVAHDEVSANGSADHQPETAEEIMDDMPSAGDAERVAGAESNASVPADPVEEDANEDEREAGDEDEGPVHRPLIRASLPRPEGQQPPARPIPEFTIRQPGGRQNRFRPRHHGGGQQGRHGHQGQQGGGHQGHQFSGGGNRSNGGGRGDMRSGRPPQGGMMPRGGRRHGPGGGGRNKPSK